MHIRRLPDAYGYNSSGQMNSIPVRSERRGAMAYRAIGDSDVSMVDPASRGRASATIGSHLLCVSNCSRNPKHNPTGRTCAARSGERPLRGVHFATANDGSGPIALLNGGHLAGESGRTVCRGGGKALWDLSRWTAASGDLGRHAVLGIGVCVVGIRTEPGAPLGWVVARCGPSPTAAFGCRPHLN